MFSDSRILDESGLSTVSLLPVFHSPILTVRRSKLSFASLGTTNFQLQKYKTLTLYSVFGTKRCSYSKQTLRSAEFISAMVRLLEPVSQGGHALAGGNSHVDGGENTYDCCVKANQVVCLNTTLGLAPRAPRLLAE